MFPLFHMAGWTIAMQQWQARDTLILVRSADPASLCAVVAEHRATRLNCIPLVWRRILELLESDQVAAGRAGIAAGRGHRNVGDTASNC